MRKIGRIGDIVIVANQKPKPGANKEYFALRVQLASGKEVNALFSEKQLADAIKRAEKNPEDVPKAGNIFDWFRVKLD
jgi:hypothetical protein